MHLAYQPPPLSRMHGAALTQPALPRHAPFPPLSLRLSPARPVHRRLLCGEQIAYSKALKAVEAYPKSQIPQDRS